MADDVKGRGGLTTERVVDAALRAADEGGIEAVSLRRLAAALEVTPMAIYRHVRNKSHLLDLMAERLLEQVDFATDESATWQDRLRRLLGSYQAVAATHPAAPFLLSRPFVSPTAPRVTEALLAILHHAGCDARQSARLLQVTSGMVLGPALHRATWAAASRGRSPDTARQETSMEALAAEEFPYSISAKQFIDWSPGPEADRLTLELLVGGLEALADQPAEHGLPAGRHLRGDVNARAQRSRKSPTSVRDDRGEEDELLRHGGGAAEQGDVVAGAEGEGEGGQRGRPGSPATPRDEPARAAAHDGRGAQQPHDDIGDRVRTRDEQRSAAVSLHCKDRPAKLRDDKGREKDDADHDDQGDRGPWPSRQVWEELRVGGADGRTTSRRNERTGRRDEPDRDDPDIVDEQEG